MMLYKLRDYDVEEEMSISIVYSREVTQGK